MRTIDKIGTSLHRRRVLALMGAAGVAVLNACGGTETPTNTAAAPPTLAPTVVPTVVPATTAASAASATRPAVASSAAMTGAATAAVSPAVGSAAAPRTASSATAGTITTAGSAVAGNAAMIPTLMIEAFDYGYRTVGSMPAGMTQIQMKNTGKETHHGSLLRLNEGVSFDQLTAALKGDENAIFGLTTFIGGPGEIDGGGTSTAILDLKPGAHVIACFIPSPNDMIPHLAKGMILPLMVSAAPAGGAATPPATLGNIMMKDFAYELPMGQVAAGRSLFTATNVGKQPHEVNVLRLAAGKQASDVTAFFAGPPMGPPPFTSVGGITGISSGLSGIFAVDLTPGSYLMACNIPDSMSGKPHLALGMIAGLTVK